MAQQEVGFDAPVDEGAGQGVFHGEQRGLGVGRLIERGGGVRGREQHAQQGLIQLRVEPLGAAVEGVAEVRFGGVQARAHVRVLGALSGEQEGGLAARRARGRCAVRVPRGLAGAQRVEITLEAGAVAHREREAMREVAAGDGEAQGAVGHRQVGVALQVLTQAFDLVVHGLGVGAREGDEGERARGRGGRAGYRRGGFLQDDVGVGAAKSK